MAQNITLLGASYADVPAVELPKTGGGTATFTDVTPTTAGAADVASGKLFFDALGVLTQGTASGGGGGASNVVTGTFKGTTTGAAMDVDLDYSGNGYPVAILVFPEEGAYNQSGTFYSLIQQYCTVFYVLIAVNSSWSDPFTALGVEAATVLNRYKSSNSNATTYNQAASTAVGVYRTEAAISGYASLIRIPSKNKLSVFIAGTSWGFAANIEYRYVVLYSE